MLDCTHCDRDVRREPGTTIAVHEGGERSPTGVYCDYGCLAAHITDGELADGHTPAVAPE